MTPSAQPGAAAARTPTVFIGSSNEALEIAEHLQAVLQDNDAAEVTIWNQSVFQLSSMTLETLIRRAENFDFAILVVTPDTLVLERGQESASARANVLFEIGLFVGTIGRERTFIVQCGEVQLPTDLSGATIAKFRRRNGDNLKADMMSSVIAIRDAIRSIGPKARSQLNDERGLFDLSDSGEFVAHMERLLGNAHRVVLIGTGLNILHRDPLRLELLRRATAGECELEIYLADPLSPSVEGRLIEEEIGDVKPPVGKHGLQLRLDTLLDDRARLGNSERVRVCVFSHYPTFALLIVDEDYFVYPYGYAALGNFSPVLCLSQRNREHLKPIQFFQAHYERVRRSATDAALRMRVREGLVKQEEELHSFAAYIVPPDNSPLYQLGSRILGFDVRSGVGLPTTWTHLVGGAAEYGFHLTVCDALYFLNMDEVALAGHEVAFLAKDYRPFELVDLRVEARFPDDHSVAIVAEDPSGTLEALHAEFATRICRKAAASNYSLRRAAATRDDQPRRAELMIRRFRAPYILQRYRPHFTLLTAVRPDEQDALAAQLQSELLNALPSRRLSVDKLAIMGKPSANTKWRLMREVSMG